MLSGFHVEVLRVQNVDFDILRVIWVLETQFNLVCINHCVLRSVVSFELRQSLGPCMAPGQINRLISMVLSMSLVDTLNIFDMIMGGATIASKTISIIDKTICFAHTIHDGDLLN